MEDSSEFQKRAPRVEVHREARLIRADGRTCEAVIVDVSSGGFRIRTTGNAPGIGEFVTLEVEKGATYPVQIRWALGDEAGGVFLAPSDWTGWR
jgi:hypothetical protein